MISFVLPPSVGAKSGKKLLNRRGHPAAKVRMRVAAAISMTSVTMTSVTMTSVISMTSVVTMTTVVVTSGITRVTPVVVASRTAGVPVVVTAAARFCRCGDTFAIAIAAAST